MALPQSSKQPAPNSLAAVARKAGVSSSTVSRVLNDVQVVKNSTKKRVLQAVAELNYLPNLHARSLAGGKTRTFGMIVSNLENPFFFDVFRHLEARAHEHGYEIIVANTDYRPEQLVRSLRSMMGRRVDGLALIVSEMEPGLMDEIAARKIPTVYYDVGKVGRYQSNIRVNYASGITRTVEYLQALGHRRLAFIGHDATLGPISERERAFVETVSRVAPDAEWRTVADADGLEGGRQAVRSLLATGFLPTAIICVNDFMAVGALRELREQELRVPEDVSVTGFDDIDLAQFSWPPLTTVHIPRDLIGELAFQALAPEMASLRPPGRETLIEPELVVRASTGPPPPDCA